MHLGTKRCSSVAARPLIICTIMSDCQASLKLPQSYRLHLPKLREFPVAMRSGETPVPIPNTTVKTRAAESTILATVWEDRWLPDL